MSERTDSLSSSADALNYDDSNTGNGLVLDGAPFGLEKLYDYEAGGHHPVRLGDRIGESGRYHVLHKLGNGGFANVWLCRDLETGPERYVALKILMAEAWNDDCPELRVKALKGTLPSDQDHDQRICLPLGDFRIDGPNGTHICIVYPVLGPRVSRSLTQ